MSNKRIVGWSVFGVVVVFLIALGIYLLTYATAETRGRIALHNQQRSAEQLQFNYEYFHNTCHDILAKGEQIEQAKANLAALTAAKPASDPFGQYANQLVQAQNNITNLEQFRSQFAQEYNSRSHQFTRNFMRSKDLPEEIGPPTGAPFESLICEG